MDDINYSDWRLTVKELKECQGFEDISDEESDKIIDSLVQLGLVVYEYSENNNQD